MARWRPNGYQRLRGSKTQNRFVTGVSVTIVKRALSVGLQRQFATLRSPADVWEGKVSLGGLYGRHDAFPIAMGASWGRR